MALPLCASLCPFTRRLGATDASVMHNTQGVCDLVRVRYASCAGGRPQISVDCLPVPTAVLMFVCWGVTYVRMYVEQVALLFFLFVLCSLNWVHLACTTFLKCVQFRSGCSKSGIQKKYRTVFKLSVKKMYFHLHVWHFLLWL